MLRPLVLIPLAMLAACSFPVVSTDPVQIRIANESTFAVDQVIVQFPGERVEYGAIAAESQSDYRETERAYPYAPVEVHLDGETLVLQPIDYVGEQLLAPGRYTYALGVDPETRELSLTLREDE